MAWPAALWRLPKITESRIGTGRATTNGLQRARIFTVNRKLTEDEYTISGTSINVTLACLAAKDCRTPLTLTVYDQSGNQVSPASTFSAESVAAYYLSISKNPNTIALCQTMMKYVDAAAAAFAR